MPIITTVITAITTSLLGDGSKPSTQNASKSSHQNHQNSWDLWMFISISQNPCHILTIYFNHIILTSYYNQLLYGYFYWSSAISLCRMKHRSHWDRWPLDCDRAMRGMLGHPPEEKPERSHMSHPQKKLPGNKIRQKISGGQILVRLAYSISLAALAAARSHHRFEDPT